ncbi:MAG: CYTH domain-containing protein [Paludibacteraceae bacterium]|jgi:CYTH domain-containing protein|nr:CYTH domain-containing protein [Paludibacteraceae bacterium]
MPKEIERKFLVVSDEYKSSPRKYYKQGYLSVEPDKTVRVRVVGDKGFLTVKGRNNGISRAEYEYEIPAADANDMLDNLVKTGVIEKWRYVCVVDGKKWEVDEFLGDNAGLVVAEIELQSEDEPFTKPAWAGDEVSGDARYYNSSLSQNPYKNWR